jgi:ATP-dependent helicase/nuclease subunit B
MIFTKNNFETGNTYEFIDQKINSGKLNELLLVVPTNRKIRYLRRELIDRSPGSCCGRMNLDTMGTFSQKMFFGDENYRDDLLSEAAAAVLLRQSFREVELKYFSNYRKNIPAGTLERIKNVISEYKRHGISPDTLKEEAQKLTGSEKIKAEDIAAIYQKYGRKIIELKLFETGDVYFELNNLSREDFNNGFRKLYPDVDLIIIEGFDEFTSPEIGIINSASAVEGCRLFLELDYSSPNPMIFKHLENTFRKLILKKFTPYPEEQNERIRFRKIIREQLFVSPVTKSGEFKESIFEIYAADREKEVDLIGKEIKEILLSGKVEPQQICVVFNLIKNYSPIVRDRFGMLGIPFNLTDRIPLKTSQPVISFLHLLEILENDFYYNNVLRAFSSDILNPGDLDIANLRKAAANLKIISGYNNWCDSLNDGLKKAASDEDAEYNFEKGMYSKALRDIKYIYDLLAPFDKDLSCRQFKHQFYQLTDFLRIQEKMVNRKFNLEENIKSFSLFTETIDEILDLMIMENGENEFPLRFFLNNIRTAVNSSRFNVKEKPGYGVLITTPNEVRGLEFDYLFIGGMVDGDMPTRYSPEIFFSGSYFRHEENHSAEERYHFYQALCSWNKRLYLAYPAVEKNKELSRSIFLNELEALFEVTKITEENYKNGLYSKEELLVHFGKYSSEDPSSLYTGETPSDFNFRELRRSIENDRNRLGNMLLPPEQQTPVLDESSKQILRDSMNDEFSITRLETYAKCPYKYFAERVLKIKPAEEPTEEIEGLELGTLIHSILYEFYTDLKKKNITLCNADDRDFKTAVDLMFEIADRKINDAGFTSPLNFFEKEKISGIDGKREASILYKFLLAERENNDGYIPEFFESGFGNIRPEVNNTQDAIVEIKAGGVKVRGKIDRIDLNRKDQTFKVVDYKLGGKKPSADDLLTGLSLQLPLYMYAAREIIKAQINMDFAPGGMEIFSLKYKEGDFGKFLIKVTQKKLSTGEQLSLNEDLIKICLDAIEKYVKAIGEGKFNLSSLKDRENKVCRYCGFKPICRIQEIS